MNLLNLKIVGIATLGLMIIGCSNSPSDSLNISDIKADITFKTINESDVEATVQMQMQNDLLSSVHLSGNDQLTVSNEFENAPLSEHKNDVNEYKYKGSLPYRDDVFYSLTFNRNGKHYEDTKISFPEGLEVLFPLQAAIFKNPQEEFRLAWEGGVLNTNYLELDVFGDCTLSNGLKLSFDQNYSITANLNEYFSIISSLIDFDDLFERAGGKTSRSLDLKVSECSATLHLNAIAENRVDPAFFGGKIKGIRTKAVTFEYIAD